MATDAFAEIRGQDEAVEVLRRAVAGGRVAHAYAFVGPAGIRAQGHGSRLRQGPGGAGRCRSGRAHRPRDMSRCPADRAEPPEKNPKGPLALRIEDIRALERLAALRPAEAAWKVFIVDDADRMTGPAPQADPEDAGGAARPYRDRPVLSQCARCPRPCSPAVRSFGSGRGRSRARGRSCPTGGARPMPPRCPRSRKAGRAERTPSCAWEKRSAETAGGRRRWWRRAGSTIATSSAVKAAATRIGRLRRAARPVARGLDELLRGLGACREAWQALQGNVSPRLTVEVLLGRLALAEAGP